MVPDKVYIVVRSKSEAEQVSEELVRKGFKWAHEGFINLSGCRKIFLGIRSDNGIITRADFDYTVGANKHKVETVEEMVSHWVSYRLNK